MREIKFRAWHTEQKRMIEVYGLGRDFLTENTFDGVDPGTNAFCGDDMNFLKIMQYTGLFEHANERTCDNEPIYEGDLIMFIDGTVLAVEWNDDTCKFQFSDGSDINDGERYGCYKKIVGNIHRVHT